MPGTCTRMRCPQRTSACSILISNSHTRWCFPTVPRVGDGACIRSPAIGPFPHDGIPCCALRHQQGTTTTVVAFSAVGGREARLTVRVRRALRGVRHHRDRSGQR